MIKKQEYIVARKVFFLGYTYKVINKKTIIKIDNNTYKRIKKKILLINKNYSNNNLIYNYSSINNYYNSFKYEKSLKIKRYINRNIK